MARERGIGMIEDVISKRQVNEQYALQCEKELEKIRLLGADMEAYEGKGFDHDQLVQLRTGLENKSDVSAYLDASIPWYRMKEKRFEAEHGEQIKDYIDKDFDWLQKEEIRLGIEQGVDVSFYADVKYLSPQMKEIRLGLEEKLDISKYADPEYDWFQMKEIREGLQHKINIDLYADLSYDFKTMQQIRLGLQEGIELQSYLSKGYRETLLEEIRKLLCAGVQPDFYLLAGLDEEQLQQIRLAHEKKINIEEYLSPNMRASQLEEIIKGREASVDVSLYGTPDFAWRQMREVRLGLEKRLDVSSYCNKHFNWQQMREIRLALENGMDVTGFAKLSLSLTDMRKAIKKLEAAAETISVPLKVDFAESIITISPDAMRAELELAPPKEGRYTEQDVMHLLKKSNILFGIDKDAIRTILREKRFGEKVTVALGKVPVFGEEGRYEFYFETMLPRRPDRFPDGTLDYNNMQYAQEVKAGQKIARYIPGALGRGGYTVTGKALLGKKGKEKPVLRGSGFILEDDKVTYTAAENGKIVFNEYYIEIASLCVVSGDVNRTTGNLNLDGDLHIHGNVDGGVFIYAKGNIVVDGMVGAATLISEGNILIRQGMQAGGNGLIQAGGDVSGPYFAAASIMAGNDLNANNLINCNVIVSGKTTVAGSAGIIAGGKIQAEKGIEVSVVENAPQVKVALSSGITEENYRKYNGLVRDIEKVRNEICVFEEGMKKFEASYSPDQLKEMSVYSRIKMAYEMKREELNQLALLETQAEVKISGATGSEIVIKDRAFPGTYIMIDMIQIRLNELITNVKFRHKGEKVEAIFDID